MFPYFKRDTNNNDGNISGGVEEGEGSGPRKEFFSLVGKQFTSNIFSSTNHNECMPFAYVKEQESYWVASESSESSDSVYRWIGMLIGSAMTSRCHLGINIPLYFFKCLLSTSTTLPILSMVDAEEIQPDLIKGFKSLEKNNTNSVLWA